MATKKSQAPDYKFSSMAVLIDGENVDRLKVESILERIGQLGTITTRRVYGDWSQEKLQMWDDTISVCALRAMHHYVHSTQKNTSDIALVIDAMDLLYTGKYDAFVIVSSDGDFSNLAVRIRNEGKFVIGVGRRKTNYNFITICNMFINQDKLSSSVGTSNPDRLKNMVETLNSKIAERDTAIKTQRDKMKEKNKAMTDLKKELSSVKKELRTSVSANKKLEAQFARLQRTNEKLQKRNGDLKKTKEILKQKTIEQKANAEHFVSDLLQKAIEGEEIAPNKYPLDVIGKKIRLEAPNFRPSDYGFSSLSKLIGSIPGVEMQTEQNRLVFSFEDKDKVLNCN